METRFQVTVIQDEDDLAVFHKKKTERFAEYDFAGSRVSSGRNSIHDYPAMLHPLLVDDLLEEFGKPGQHFYDPFCGSGTSLVQAVKRGLIAYGTDINPLALLIAHVRGTNIDPEEYEKHLKVFTEEYPTFTPSIPEIKNIEYWYGNDVVNDLGKIRNAISRIDNNQVKMLFLTAFSTTVRKVSYTKKGEFKRVRMSPAQIEKQFTDTYGIYLRTLAGYYSVLQKDKLHDNFHLFQRDLRMGIPFDEKIDLIITSPPYGDSRTTVAYGQFSSFGLEWIKGLNPFGDADLRLDNYLLGGSYSRSSEKSNISQNLNDTLNLIALKDIKRAREVGIFFTDLLICIKNIARQLNENATVCFIVGNRNVKGITIPMDTIIVDFFEYFGLEHIATRVRKISNKRMAIKNSPSNIKGETCTTMNYEYIVIFKGR
ncbi:MAG: hypothetical protein A2Y33_14550 [Spirochaetes bacterium GWF1_51_8]|nr:MAG: hypothetical protein A2Y33_14550 [Spirochaetes bacterium GWF1_51_8]